MVSGGHNAKSTTELRIAGTYRKDRHGDRLDDRYQGQPKQIRGMGKDAKWLWDSIVNSSPSGVLAHIDSAALFAMCRWWAMYRKFDRKAASVNGTSSDLHMAVCAWKQCSQLMIQFGVTPVARTRIKHAGADPKDDPSDPLTAMIRNRGSEMPRPR